MPEGDAERAELALRVVRNVKGWQRVLHGGCLMLREKVTELLIESGYSKAAVRYAMCGLGDQLMSQDGEVRVSARGCGHSLCPRCGRRRGSKYVRRVLGWLAHEAHGDLWNICLTQQVRGGEEVGQAKARMAVKCRAFMRWLTRRGLVGATTAHHLKWSDDRGGWHYHVHIVVELPAGTFTREREEGAERDHSPEMREEWARIGQERGEPLAPLFCAPLVAAGGAIVELREDGGDAEFWKESTSEVARVVQYPMRDMAQGVSSWRLGVEPEIVKEVCRELLHNAKGWKLRRAWGRWRQSCPAAVEAERAKREGGDEGQGEDDGAERAAAPGSKGTPHGTLNRVWLAARSGDPGARRLMKGLELSVRNSGDFARRLVIYCRAAWAPQGESG